MTDKNYFEIKKEHLTLLKNANIIWEDCEFGAPAIDCKRPYGNSSVEVDIFEILYGEPKSIMKIDGKEYNIDIEDFEMPQELEDKIIKLHEETVTALQIILQTQKFEVGKYESDKYVEKWTKIE